MKVAFGADHGGFELKKYLVEIFRKSGYEVIDVGNLNFDPQDDYPDYAIKVAEIVASGQAERGVIICGSGVGACVAANKIKGIRACLCHDTYSAHQGVEHDAMNILSLGARIIGQELAKELVFSFLNAKFINEERFIRRLEKVNNIDK
ncbi:MAG: ribose 5-phosphate isomerase B [Ignavibacteriaceae bacterium]|jgi:ribose 5-phosphate isomerase B